MAKFELEDFVQFGQLFEIYGGLLSNDRQSICLDYFSYNMTLAEIAEQRNISRQAVLDAVKKSCKKLQAFENELGLFAKRTKLKKLLEEIAQSSSKRVKEKVEKALKEI